MSKAMNTFGKTSTPLPLTMLRGVAERFGEAGAFALLAALVGSAVVLFGSTSGLAGPVLAATLLAASGLGAFARAMDARGQEAMRRLERPAAQTNEELELRRRFGLRDDSDAETVRKDFAARMKAWHSDAGTGGVDMDEVKTARNRLFHLVSSRGSAASGRELVSEWGRVAGLLGRAWGRVLPSDRLARAMLDAQKQDQGAAKARRSDGNAPA